MVKLRPATAREAPIIKMTVSPESWRFTAYCFFWSMCIFAITMSKIFVVPYLAAGPKKEGDICGPFNRDAPDFGVNLGEGFDFNTQSHLIQLFGFANICANWDYSPSREMTAMFYPLFEYSLILYLCLDFLQVKLSYQRGELSEWFWTFSKIVFPINVVLCSQFRMIFVCIAYLDVQKHTAGFLGLQVALMLVAISNTLYVYDSNECLNLFGTIEKTRLAGLVYLVGDLIISSIKITATIFVVQNGYGAPWTLNPSGIPGLCVGQVVDQVWMIFNAVLPLIISYNRAKSEYPLEIAITSEEPSYVEDTGEGAPLTGGSSGAKYESAMTVAI